MTRHFLSVFIRSAISIRPVRQHVRVTTVTHHRCVVRRLCTKSSDITQQRPSVNGEMEQNEVTTESKEVLPGPKEKAIADLQQMLGLLPSDIADKKFKDLVFVSIDCEAFEFKPKDITEVGISVLDTRALAGVAPGEGAEAWLQKIQYAHYRPVEYSHHVNKRWVKGCPRSFNFGHTTWIRRPDANRVLTRIFHDPSNLSRATDFDMFDYDDSEPPRNVVLVGHSLGDDAAHLRHLGFALREVTNVVTNVDTQALVSTKKHPVGLQRLLMALGIEPKDLHNAGNDAAYTMQAMILIAVKEHLESGSVAGAVAEFVGQKLAPAERSGYEAPEIWAGSARKPVVSSREAESGRRR